MQSWLCFEAFELNGFDIVLWCVNEMVASDSSVLMTFFNLSSVWQNQSHPAAQIKKGEST